MPGLGLPPSSKADTQRVPARPWQPGHSIVRGWLCAVGARAGSLRRVRGRDRKTNPGSHRESTKRSRGSSHLPEVRNGAEMGGTGIQEFQAKTSICTCGRWVGGWVGGCGEGWDWKAEGGTHRLFIASWAQAVHARAGVYVMYRDQRDHCLVGINIKCCVPKSNMNRWLCLSGPPLRIGDSRTKCVFAFPAFDCVLSTEPVSSTFTAH